MPNSSKALFGRVVRMRIIPDASALSPDANVEDPSIVTIDGFDMSFDIEKTHDPTPNKAKFEIYNLPEKVRSQLELKKNKAKIEFKAGYKNTASIVFSGDLTHALSSIRGPDWVTVVEGAEGQTAQRKSRAAKTFGAGTPYKTIIQYVVSTFEGYKVTPQITKAIASLGKAAPNGLTVDGPSAKVLNDVLRGLGLGFTMQNGQIMIIEPGKASDLPAVKLGYDSGLVDIPTLGEKTDKPTMQFKSLLQGELFPWRKVEISSPGVKGTFVLDNVHHKGANFGTEFYSHCQAFL